MLICKTSLVQTICLLTLNKNTSISKGQNQLIGWRRLGGSICLVELEGHRIWGRWCKIQIHVRCVWVTGLSIMRLRWEDGVVEVWEVIWIRGRIAMRKQDLYLDMVNGTVMTKWTYITTSGLQKHLFMIYGVYLAF